ncbi:MAG: LysM peptidoglycan-binding domain-containing protein [Clostridia bacterium]|nr:LysM peptidoglycan-binding domain-containing protein [Clostridia bacterium]
MKKINVKRRTNIKAIIAIVLAILAINLITSVNKSYSKVEISYKTEYVSCGDTLWSIAKRESKNNKYYQDKDVREIIYDLKKINNLSNSDLSEGQEIKIPKM